MSERKACRRVGQPRGTQRYQPTQRADEDELTKAIVALASQYGRHGYRRITASASAPFVATLVDVTGIVIYFSVAAVVLRGTML